MSRAISRHEADVLERSPALAALAVAGGAAFALAAAWYFQVVVGLAPCPLCLEQRIPYYIAVPLGLAAFALGRAGHGRAARLAVWLLAALMAVDAGIAIFHAGVEAHLWQGPAECTGTVPPAFTDVLAALKTVHVPRCDEPAWVFLGLSMAAWNALIALGLTTCALWGATSGRTEKAG